MFTYITTLTHEQYKTLLDWERKALSIVDNSTYIYANFVAVTLAAEDHSTLHFELDQLRRQNVNLKL